MKIVFLGEDRKKFEYIKENLKVSLKRHKFGFFDKALTDKNLRKIKDVECLVLFIDENIDRRIMRDLPDLKAIITMSTGYDHIDLMSSKEFGISVSNVPSYGENTVAEHSFGLILNLSRKIWLGIDRVKEDNFSLSGLQGFDLKGKTIGLIGLGKIGRHVARIAYGFEMNVLGFDRSEDLELKKKYGVRYTNLNELLEKSDVISLHLPLNGETEHLINKKNIKKIKTGAILVNTSRGALIETGALRYALDKGILSACALDVLEGEEEIKEEKDLVEKEEKISDWRTLIENHLLIDYDNVIVTPHMAFYSIEAEKRILDETVKNIIGFLEGKVRNKVE